MRIICYLLFLLFPLQGYSLERLVVLYDDYPPFEYLEAGESRGIGAEVVKIAFERAGLRPEFRYYPFTRAYKMVTEGREPLFYFSLAKTLEREGLLQWIGVVAPSSQALFSYGEGQYNVRSLEDLTPHRIGVVNEDVVEQYLKKYEKNLNLKLDRVSDYEQNMKKLIEGSVQLWGGNSLVAYYLLDRLGVKRDAIKQVFELKELKGDYYLVGSRHVPKKIVLQLQNAFSSLHRDGTYQKILQKYRGP